MGLGVLFSQIVGVIGADHGNSGLLMEAQQSPVHLRLLRDAVVLQLQIEFSGAENVLHLQGVLLGVLKFAVTQQLGDLAGQAGGQGDEAAAVLLQEREVDAGLDVKALCPAHGDHVGEVAVPLLILTQKHQMAALGVKFMHFFKPGAASGRHIHLAADDGLDPLRFAGAVEVDGAVHDAMVRDGAGSLPHPLDHLGQVTDAAGAVQQAVFGMDV